MATNREPPKSTGKVILLEAKQSFADLFKWKQRVIVINELGESHTEWHAPAPLRNPVSLIAQLSGKDWIYFFLGWFAWVTDIFDFTALSIQIVKLSEYYHTSKTHLTTAITLTLLLRSVGAAIFGLLGDRFGRKWPLVFGLVVIGFLQIGTIYAATFRQFILVRALFGIFMGGVYGNAAAMALENCPVEARGFISGLFQQGAAVGLLLAAITVLAVGGGANSWKTVFWVGSGLSFSAGLLRCFFAESKQFREARASGEKITASDMWKETKEMLANEWRMTVYCSILMTWLGYHGHAGTDNYTTFYLVQKGLDNSAAMRVLIVAKIGSILGGPIAGYLSQWLGRRRSIIGSSLMSVLLIPALILPEGERAFSVAGFFLDFFTIGIIAPIPIHLSELSPSAYRSTFPGVTYQIGNAISSPGVQIINAIAESHFVRNKAGDRVEAYGPTIAIALAILTVGIIVTIAVGPERRGRAFVGGPIGTNIHRDTEKAVGAVSVDEKPPSADVKEI
ncbi:carboxylic acid transport protein [Xylaria intraflava]|nr:carboxylic acid transport protein [Xylaria intraflava]